MIPVTPDTLNSMIVAAQAAQNSTSSLASMKAEPKSPQRKQAQSMTQQQQQQQSSGHLPTIVQAALSRLSPGDPLDADYDEASKAKRSRTNGDEFDT